MSSRSYDIRLRGKTNHHQIGGTEAKKEREYLRSRCAGRGFVGWNRKRGGCEIEERHATIATMMRRRLFFTPFIGASAIHVKSPKRPYPFWAFCGGDKIGPMLVKDTAQLGIKLGLIRS